MLLMVTAVTVGGCSGKKWERVDLAEEEASAGSSEGGFLSIIMNLAEESKEEIHEAGPVVYETEAEGNRNGTVVESVDRLNLPAGEIVSLAEIERNGLDTYFTQSYITGDVFLRINENSYREDCVVPLEELRYLQVLHYDFNGNVRKGEIVCNQSISDDLLTIFRRLYENQYPIEKILLVDEYEADDNLSSADNNTSCFNFRTVAGTSSMSLHATGSAIDINPLYNPYVTTDSQGNVSCAPANGRGYMDRSRSFDHKIDQNDLCYRLFVEYGFTWGGSWSSQPDYMHFSRGNRL